MAKSEEKNKALGLRKEGESIKDIAKRLGIAKSTVSLWCRDIELTQKQISALHERMVAGSYKGRMKGARMQHRQRLERIFSFQKQGMDLVGKVSNRDILIAGIALYWGEGNKKRDEVRVSNSDPEIIKFMLNWFKRICNIDNDMITLSVNINKIHQNRVEEVEEYWSEITKIPKQQFIKTTLIKAKNKKNYNNFPTHYGTLTIRVRKSTNLHHKIIGMINALASRRSSVVVAGSS